MTGRTPAKSDRNAALRARRAEGATILQLSREFALSEARVQQLLAAPGTEGSTPRPVLVPGGRFGSVTEAAAAYRVARTTVRRWLASGIATAGLSLALLPVAQAQERMPCAKLAELTAGLAEHYQEKPIAAGLQANGQLLEIFASPGGVTWTALTTSPAGLACVVATGRDWQQGPAGEPL